MWPEFCSLFLKNFYIFTKYYSNNFGIILFRYDGLQSFRNTLRKLALLLYLLKNFKTRLTYLNDLWHFHYNFFDRKGRAFWYVKVYIFWKFSKLPIERHKIYKPRKPLKSKKHSAKKVSWSCQKLTLENRSFENVNFLNRNYLSKYLAFFYFLTYYSVIDLTNIH